MCDNNQVWKNPKKDKPKDGETILIREYYKSPKYGRFTNDFRVVVYFEDYGFEAFERINHHIPKYKITHWMSIPPIK